MNISYDARMSCLIYAKHLEVSRWHDEKAAEESPIGRKRKKVEQVKECEDVGIEVKCPAK